MEQTNDKKMDSQLNEKTTDKRKQSLYFPEEMLQEIRAEAARQDRSLSWIIQRSWAVAKGQLAKMPSIADQPTTPPADM